MVTAYNLKESNLFKPIKVGDVTLKNRVALAPLTRGRNSDDHIPFDYVKDYYDQRSRREGTLIISEAVLVSFKSSGQYQPPGIYNEKQAQKWKGVIEAIHKNKSFFFLQIWALGLYADPALTKSLGLKYLAPSSNVYIKKEDEEAAIAAGNPSYGLTTQEVEEYIQDFVNAAKKSIELGADGVELHAANGYLPFQFLYDNLNKRTDRYGGSIEKKANFILDIVDGVGKAVGYSKIGVRLSPFFRTLEDVDFFEDQTIATYSYLIGELESRRKQGKKIAFIHLVEPRADLVTKNLHITNDFVYQIFKGVIVRADGYTSDFDKLRKHVQADERTVIAFGRHFISNPDLADRLENDWPLTPYDRSSFYVGGEKGYLDYPFYEQK
ncbi:NADPH dehydrogenase 2 [Wickerhamomyces ciferrii]|uniref:NADPH dehydrogenase 2 n=1 Tax=Wickerhamomyces ciferrii (strain ATCC 14091 / BCRC 22168 / CBS 111 / JCM 3599 / NBRC 0793 / NRRL Y-1031 F-60-10) TaxID=1206466 RepID=K0K9A1_WICCF|nr:NADPH dehydrogenase 2 [Wickerhamomyces ciferrii]CCH41485.1 NADPH dehydrogenase 2 [Wickerhamomyces ciferrii]